MGVTTIGTLDMESIFFKTGRFIPNKKCFKNLCQQLDVSTTSTSNPQYQDQHQDQDQHLLPNETNWGGWILV
jgi:hypothetical protein